MRRSDVPRNRSAAPNGTEQHIQEHIHHAQIAAHEAPQRSPRHVPGLIGAGKERGDPDGRAPPTGAAGGAEPVRISSRRSSRYCFESWIAHRGCALCWVGAIRTPGPPVLTQSHVSSPLYSAHQTADRADLLGGCRGVFPRARIRGDHLPIRLGPDAEPGGGERRSAPRAPGPPRRDRDVLHGGVARGAEARAGAADRCARSRDRLAQLVASPGDVAARPDEFGDDVRRCRTALEQAAGRRVLGFRAPSFSIVPGTDWAFDVLIDAGYAYDSSVFPIRRPGYGYPGAPAVPYGFGVRAAPCSSCPWRRPRSRGCGCRRRGAGTFVSCHTG